MVWMVKRMKLTEREQFDIVYHIFEQSFIPGELRPYDKMKDLWLQKKFKIYQYEKQGSIVGGLSLWEFDDFIYIENFAVKEEMRGYGIGGQMIDYIQSLYAGQLLVLEVDKPVDKISQQRIAFYQRHHWIYNHYHYIQPNLRSNSPIIHLMIMSYPTPLDDDLFTKIKLQIFQQVYNVNKRGK